MQTAVASLSTMGRTDSTKHNVNSQTLCNPQLKRDQEQKQGRSLPTNHDELPCAGHRVDVKDIPTSNGSTASMILHATDFIVSGDLPVDSGDSFYMVDIGACVKLYQHLAQSMPRVTPHYAVKCFPDPNILAALAQEGAGFDTASKNELEMVMKLGVDARYLIGCLNIVVFSLLLIVCAASILHSYMLF